MKIRFKSFEIRKYRNFIKSIINSLNYYVYQKCKNELLVQINTCAPNHEILLIIIRCDKVMYCFFFGGVLQLYTVGIERTEKPTHILGNHEVQIAPSLLDAAYQTQTITLHI